MIMPSYWQRICIPEHILRKLLAHGSPSCFSNCTFQVSRPFYWQIKFVTPVTVNHPQRPLKAWIRVFFQHQVNNRWWSDRLSGSLSTIHSCYYWQWRGVYNSPSGRWDPVAWARKLSSMLLSLTGKAKEHALSPAKFCAFLTWFSVSDSYTLQLCINRKVRLLKYPETLLGYLSDTIKSL